MAYITETTDSRESNVSLDAPTRTLRYFIGECDSDAGAKVLVEATIPAFYNSLPFQGYRLTPNGPSYWIAEVSYARKEPKKPGTVKIEFDTGTNKSKITHSLASVYYPAPGQSTIDYGGAINVKESGGKRKVEGVDIDEQLFGFVVTKVFGETDTPLTTTQLGYLQNKAGHVNSDDFEVTIQGLHFTFPGGSLHYKNCTGGRGGDGQSEVSLKFEYIPNLTGATIAGISGVDKKGWHYVWVVYEEEEDSDSSMLVPVARQVCVEQILPETTLAELFT